VNPFNPNYHIIGAYATHQAQLQAEAERQRQAAEQLRVLTLAAAAAAMRATGAVCAVRIADGNPPRHCGDHGAGRCKHCQRVFCLSHRSDRPAYEDFCAPCQAEQRRQAEDAAAAQRRSALEAAEAARLAAERAEEEHAAKVAKREASLGWPDALKRIAVLDELTRGGLVDRWATGTGRGRSSCLCRSQASLSSWESATLRVTLPM
jgi:hypothetical protein